jgi:ThiF family
MTWDDATAARLARHLQLPALGREGNDRIRSASVHVVGAGAVAGPALLYLAQAGVGTLYLDDGADVTVADARAWLYAPEHAGQQRLFPGIEAVRAASALTKVRAYSSDTTFVNAALVCPDTVAVARKAAEQVRLSGLPHVVGFAGQVVVIPSGAPCFQCASKPAPLPPLGGAAAALGALAAAELLLLIAQVGDRTGRRITFVDGWPAADATVRRPRCDCVNVY